MYAAPADPEAIRRIEGVYERATAVALLAHHGQEYAPGIPHFRHVKAVSEGAACLASEVVQKYRCDPVLIEDARCLGMIHDGPEDNADVTFSFLLDVRIPARVVCGAYGMIQRPGEDRVVYRSRLCRSFGEILGDSWRIDPRLADWLGGMSREQHRETAYLVSAAVTVTKCVDIGFNADRGKILALWGRDRVCAAYKAAGVRAEDLSAWEKRQLLKESAGLFDTKREAQRRKYLRDCQKLDRHARSLFPGFDGFSDIISRNKLARSLIAP